MISTIGTKTFLRASVNGYKFRLAELCLFVTPILDTPSMDSSASQYSLGKRMVLSVNQNVMPSRGKSVNGIFLM
jgi:hypothetical protein